MNGEVFHYKTMRHEGELLSRLATILTCSGLQVISAGFSGDWEKAISHRDDWRTRLPSPYHLAFEICAEQMERSSASLWNSEPVAVVFSRQREYAKQAEFIWRSHKASGFWKNVLTFAYGDPETTVQLQAADMIAYEVFQCMKTGDEEDHWHRWPLSRALLEQDATHLGVYHTTKTFIEMMEINESQGRKYLTMEDPKKKG